jgi:hypothetical protein
MADVHVNVSHKKKSGSLPKRTVRWADRALLGLVMGIAAFVIERAVVRGSRRAEDARERKLDEESRDNN